MTTPRTLVACARALAKSQHTHEKVVAENYPHGARACGGWSRYSGSAPVVDATADALRALQIALSIDALPVQARAAAYDFVRKTMEPLSPPSEAGGVAVLPSTIEVAAAARALSTPLLWDESEARNWGGRVARWLVRAADPKGGWGHHQGGEPALLPTYHAVWALDIEISRSDNTGNKRRAGRDFIFAASRSLGQNDQLAWSQTPNNRDGLSPAATALAVMSLAHSEDHSHQGAALKGARWLAHQAEIWSQKSGRWEQILPSRDGFLPAVVICPLALVSSRADLTWALGPVAKGLRVIDDLWKTEWAQWNDGEEGPYVGTLRAMLSLDRALRTRWNKSWDVVLSEGTARRPKLPRVELSTISGTLSGRTLTIQTTDSSVEPLTVEISEGMARMLRLLVAEPGSALTLAALSDVIRTEVSNETEATSFPSEASLRRYPSRLVNMIVRGIRDASTYDDAPSLWRCLVEHDPPVELSGDVIRACWALKLS